MRRIVRNTGSKSVPPVDRPRQFPIRCTTYLTKAHADSLARYCADQGYTEAKAVRQALYSFLHAAGYSTVGDVADEDNVAEE